jgi:hypothetical protein
MNKKVVYDGRHQVPRPSDPSWAPNKVAAAYSNLPAAPYTRVGPAGTAAPGMLPAPTAPTTTANSTAPAAIASAKPTTPSANPASTPGVAPLSDQSSSFARATPPVPSGTDKDNVLAMREQMTMGDPPSLSARPVTSSKTPEGLVTSAYMPARNTLAAESRLGMSGVRVVNNKRITLNYKINDVGPSGVSSIDVWVTHDGRVWKKLDVGTQTHPPCIVEVSDEGLYGFSLLARNGLGLGKAPPQAGDVPQVWVDVDLTRPTVQLMGVEVTGPSKGTAIISWSAADKNLGPRPITLSYSETGKGMWTPIAASLANSGRYIWQMPSSVSGRFLVRVEATDLAGNTGSAQSQEPVLIDLSQPTISILNVECGK